MAELSADTMRSVSEQRAAQLVGTSRSTIQSWDKEQFFERPEGGLFGERHVFELLLAAALRDELSLSEAKSVWRNLRRTGAIGEFLELAQRISGERDQLDLVMDIEFGGVAFVCDSDSLLEFVRGGQRPKRVYVAPLGSRICLAREGFESFASTEQASKPRRGRPPKAAASVHTMNPER